jgi:hypothetical protein
VCSPLFLADGRGRPPGRSRCEDLNGPDEPAIADQRELNLESGRSLQTRNAGIFLFLPLLVKLRFDRMATNAGYPSSKMVPASSALLALLMLKLLDKERRGHINDFNFDEALGLFAGLNVLPKKSFATDYSYRTTREHQRALLQAWVDALGKVMFPAAHTFSLDFHPIPYRGDPTGLDRHYIPCRGAAGPSVQTFFALEQESRCLCYANANLIRSDQPGELMQFVAFWHALTGQNPQWLYFDSKLVDYPELSNINKRGIHFITIRRRGTAILRRLDALPRSSWAGAVLDTPQRCHQQIWYVDESIKLRGYEGPIRQLAVDGLGREKPTLFLTNHFEETARNIVIRYAGRNRVEDGLGISVNFFHLDCLASEVRLSVDLDATLTVLANGCYRWLGKHLRGYEKAAPKQLYRLFVATQGFIKVTPDELIVRFERRSHNPILREAALDRDRAPIPWLGGRRIRFEFT